MIFRATGFSKSYNGTQILEGVDIELKGGEAVALLGPNGSGKSTLLRCLSMVESPDSGAIDFDGTRLVFPLTESHPPFSPDISLVFQQLFLWPNLTVKQNIQLPLRRRFPGDHNTRLHQIVERLGLVSMLDRYPNSISVGQRQLTAIARAVALEPKVLLLDEITSALDSLNAVKISEIFSELKAAGTAILFVTHSINFAILSAERFIVLESGEIVESSCVEEINDPRSTFLRSSKVRGVYLY